MKKITALLIAFVFLISLAACGNNTNNTAKDDENKKSSEDNTAKSKEDVDEKKEDEQKEEKKNDEDNTNAGLASIEEKVIYDANDIVVKTKSLVYDADGMLEGLKLNIENKKSDPIKVTIGTDFSVNDFLVYAMLLDDIQPNTSDDYTIDIATKALKKANIKNIKNIEFGLTIFDKDYMWINEGDENIVVETNMKDLEDDNEMAIGGDVIYDENGIKMSIIGTGENEVIGQYVELYTENNSDIDIHIINNKVVVDGKDVTILYSERVGSHKKQITLMGLIEFNLEQDKMKKVKSANLSFNILEDNDEMKVLYTTNEGSVSFKE